MNKKYFFNKLVSLLLVSIFTLNVIPYSVLATEFKNREIKEVEDTQELLTESTEYSNTYEMGNGIYKSVISNTPINYKKDGEWREIDNTIEKISTYKGEFYTNKYNDISFQFPKFITSSQPITIVNNDHQLELFLESQNSNEIQIENNLDEKTNSTIFYKNVFSHTDLEFNIRNKQLQSSIQINNKPNDLLSYSFRLNTGNLSAFLTADGSIEIVNNNLTKFSITPPLMYDSVGQYKANVQVKLEMLEKGSYVFTYTPDMSLFNEPVTYPVQLTSSLLTSELNIDDVNVLSYSSSNENGELNPDRLNLRKYLCFNFEIPKIKSKNLVSANFHFKNIYSWTYPPAVVKVSGYNPTVPYDFYNLTGTKLNGLLTESITSFSTSTKEYDISLTSFIKKNIDNNRNSAAIAFSGSSQLTVGPDFKFIIQYREDLDFNLQEARSAVFTNQNITTIENENQLTGTFNSTVLEYDYSNMTLTGEITFKDNQTSNTLYFENYICQSHMDLTGNRSLVAGRNLNTTNSNIVLASFRIEENCESLTLMPVNIHLKGKTVISIGILNKNTNKIYYMQQELKINSFDALYSSSISKDEQYGFLDTAVLQSDEQEIQADEGVIREREYLSLMQRSDDQLLLADTPENATQKNTRSISTDLKTLMENGSQDIPKTPRTAGSGFTSMRDLLDHLRTNRSYSINDPLVSKLVRNHFMYPTPYHWFGYFVGFNSSDSLVDQENPYFYARYSVNTAGTSNSVTSIILVDIRDTIYKRNRDIGIQVRANMDIAFDATSKTIFVLEGKMGNAKISQVALIQRITNDAGEFSNAQTSVMRSQDPWGSIASIFTLLGFLPKGSDAVLDGLTSAYQMTSRLKMLYSIFILHGKTESAKYSIDGHVIGTILGGLSKPNDDIVNPGSFASGDYALLHGTLDRDGYYNFMDYYTIEVSIRAFDKYRN